ncbi:mitochondrial import inner membrane translocase subunit Tim29 [Polymixia lowei]
MASSMAMKRWFSAAVETVVTGKTTRWERLVNSKAGVWCRGLFSDYKEAFREIVVGTWERPVKASFYLGLLGSVGACFYTKPDNPSFEANLLKCSNQLGLLSPWIRSGTSNGHVQNLVKLHNEGRLRHISLGVVSLIYCADYHPDASLYEAQCSNLSVPWRVLPERVLDVGFARHWWILESKMKNYDVNEEEFKHLPVYMQATIPPSVQEVERNEKLHRDSWLPLKLDNEEK